MQNYESKLPSYFATPSPQLIRALHTSLTQILRLPLSTRFAKHRTASRKVKDTAAKFGLTQLATDPANQANGMTAFWLPEKIETPQVLLAAMAKRGVVMAGGLHKDIAKKYFRFGHMGISVMGREDEDRGGEGDVQWDVEGAIEVLRGVLLELGCIEEEKSKEDKENGDL